MLQRIIDAIRAGSPFDELIREAEAVKSAKDAEVAAAQAALDKARRERDVATLLVERLKA